MKQPAFYTPDDVYQRLDYPGCIDAMRQAMIALSLSHNDQPLRSILKIGEGKLFGLMPGRLEDFGAKLVSVFEDPARPGRGAHKGIVVLFEADRGNPIAIADAGSVTEIRTAAMTVAATKALARPETTRLSIFGTGTQARSHLAAFAAMPGLTHVKIWGRSEEKAAALAQWGADVLGLNTTVALDPEKAAQADIICTVTSSSEPVLRGAWVSPGTHVNLVGSSYAGPVEADTELLQKARFIVDHRPSAEVAAAEWLVAKSAGAVTDADMIAEIGEVFAGQKVGREADLDITVYKSLGNIVQDLAALAYIHEKPLEKS